MASDGLGVENASDEAGTTSARARDGAGAETDTPTGAGARRLDESEGTNVEVFSATGAGAVNPIESVEVRGETVIPEGVGHWRLDCVTISSEGA